MKFVWEKNKNSDRWELTAKCEHCGTVFATRSFWAMDFDKPEVRNVAVKWTRGDLSHYNYCYHCGGKV